jgi:copper chaperone
MPYAIQVENIKCGGCASSIVNKLTQSESVASVNVVVESGTVEIDGDAAHKAEVIKTLQQLGYPETGSVAGLQAAGAKAKSYVSCAIGRMGDKS